MDSLDDVRSHITQLNIGDPRYQSAYLPLETHLYQRGKPGPYLNAALSLLDALGGKTIVEVGCMGEPLTHPLEETHPDCCSKGHSTYIWARSGKPVYSVDSDPKAVAIARKACTAFSNCHISLGDGIEYLRTFPHPIDLLYLDAWDVQSSRDYALQHLKAYLMAAAKLSESHIVVIDDTDIDNGGKGKLLVPLLKTLEYEVLVEGRQTIALLMYY